MRRAALVLLFVSSWTAGDEEHEKLDRALTSKEPAERVRALRRVGRLRADATSYVPRLLKMLRAPDVTVRREAALALNDVDPEAGEALPVLIDALKDADWHRRWRAALALGRVGPAAHAAVPALRTAMRDPACDVRREAILTLGRIGPAAAPAVPALRDALAFSEWHLQLNVALALARIGPAAKPAAPDLVKLLASENPYLAEAAVQAVFAVGKAAQDAVRESDAPPATKMVVRRRVATGRIHGSWRKRLLGPGMKRKRKAGERALHAEMAVGVNALRAALSNGDVDARAKAATGLAGWGAHAREARELLLRRAEADPDATVRRNAVIALGRILRPGDPERDALDRLLLGDPSAAVRVAALRVHLRRAGNPRLLVRVLDDPDVWVRVTALRGLGAIGDAVPGRVRRRIRVLAKDGHPMQTRAARTTLDRIEGELPADD